MQRDESYSRADALRELRDIAARQSGADGRGRRILEADHEEADEILLRLLGDDELRQAFDSIEKWYA